MKQTVFKLGELFCGPGGMALGAKLALSQTSKDGEVFSISHLWGVDRDRNAIATYNANELGEGVCCDATAFVASNKGCAHKTIADFDSITALAFGFPCNDFSTVGERRGTGGVFGQLYKAGVAALNIENPMWFVAENVSGIHSANSGEAFKQIQKELSSAGKHGYDLTVNLYKFEDYGIPQYRHRYIIVGIRKDLKTPQGKKVVFKIPAPTHLGNHTSAREALSRHCAQGVANCEFTEQQDRKSVV